MVPACLWFCISFSMFVFCCAISKPLGFCRLVVLRCFIMFLMCSGSSLCVWCIFPFGIRCLSAANMALVSIFVAVCVRFVVLLCLRVFVQFLV